MLHAQIPVDRVREFDVRRNPVRRAGASVGFRKNLNSRSASGQAAAAKEIRCLRGEVDIVRCTDLRGPGEDADVVIESVVGQAKACANRGSATASRGVGDAYARSPVVFWSLRRVKQQRLVHGSANDDARRIGDGVQRLVCFAAGDRGVFVANSQVKGKIRFHLPIVVHIPVDCLLVSVVGDGPLATLAEVIRGKVVEEELRRVVFVVATLTLGETLRRNVPTVLAAELKCVSASIPAYVVDNLIRVLNRELRSLGIGAELQAVAAQIEQDDIRKRVESRILKTTVGQDVVVAVVADTELVKDRRAERVVFADRKKMIPERLNRVEG